MTRRHRRAHVVVWGLIVIGLSVGAFVLSSGLPSEPPAPAGEATP